MIPKAFAREQLATRGFQLAIALGHECCPINLCRLNLLSVESLREKKGVLRQIDKIIRFWIILAERHVRELVENWLRTFANRCELRRELSRIRRELSRTSRTSRTRAARSCFSCFSCFSWFCCAWLLCLCTPRRNFNNFANSRRGHAPARS